MFPDGMALRKDPMVREISNGADIVVFLLEFRRASISFAI